MSRFQGLYYVILDGMKLGGNIPSTKLPTGASFIFQRTLTITLRIIVNPCQNLAKKVACVHALRMLVKIVRRI